MTLPLEPLSVEDALDKAIGGIGMPGVIAATMRSRSYLEKLRSPARREQLTVVDMIKIDAAHVRKHGTAPIFETIAASYQSLHAELFPDAIALGDLTVDVIHETAEAECAMIVAARPQATQRDWDHAERQVADAVPALARALAFIKQRKSRNQQPP